MGFFANVDKCESCKGSGYTIHGQKCIICDGTGKKASEKSETTDEGSSTCAQRNTCSDYGSGCAWCDCNF